ncbi:hypothetical protein G9C98_008421 [Cotesia typhae]|uniref:Platelet-derived growth factor receptor-like protein n=1 Tax=Cotesia typhae TaxID=2053667 RepID=A0A8J5QUE0_9HYME|nr:hypothetical protein G9C98_008421 [Cotesia typhae]
MDLRHLIILLLSSSLCSSEITIFPNLSEINLEEGDELELTCTSTDGGDIDFFYPKSIDDRIETSSVEIVRDPTSDPFKFTLRRRKTYFGDTGCFIGGNAIFPCRPNSPETTVTLSHENSAEVLPLDDRLSFDSKVGFTLLDVSKNDSGTYACKAENSVDDWIYIKLDVLGIVYVKFSTENFKNKLAATSTFLASNAAAPVMINSYSLQQMTLGQDFSINCSIYYGGDFSPSLLRWITPRVNKQITKTLASSTDENASEYFSELTIKKVTVDDVGEYTCQYYGYNIETVKINLQLHIEPTIVQNSEDAEIISASYNQSISAECEAQGNPLPIIIWKYFNHFENSTEHTAEGDLFNVRYITSNTVDGKKTISTIDVKAQNTGKLICKACNEVDCNSSVVKVINVPVLMKLPPDQPATSDYQVVSLSEGETLHIFCASTKDTIFFYPILGNDFVNSNITLGLQEVGSKDAWFERKQVVYGDSGWYACANLPVEYLDLSEYWFSFTPDNYKDPNVQWKANLNDHLLYDPKKGFTMLNITWEMPFFVYCTINDTITGNLQRRDFNVYLERPTNGIDSPKIFTETLTHMVVGKPFTLQCKVYFNRVKTNYKFKWNTPKPGNRITHLYQLNGTEKTSIENSQPQTGFVIYELTIENVTPEHFGEYGCFIYEYSTVKSDTIYLAPHGTIQLAEKERLTSGLLRITRSMVNHLRLFWKLETPVLKTPALINWLPIIRR